MNPGSFACTAGTSPVEPARVWGFLLLTFPSGESCVWWGLHLSCLPVAYTFSSHLLRPTVLVAPALIPANLVTEPLVSGWQGWCAQQPHPSCPGGKPAPDGHLPCLSISILQVPCWPGCRATPLARPPAFLAQPGPFSGGPGPLCALLCCAPAPHRLNSAVSCACRGEEQRLPAEAPDAHPWPGTQCRWVTFLGLCLVPGSLLQAQSVFRDHG